MIYVTITTRNRFWHSALTMLSVVQSANKGCFIHVLDDASDDEMAETKRHLFTDLSLRRLVSRYEPLPERIGFCAGRELLVERFLNEPRFSHWFHLDDDILIGTRTILTAVQDLEGPLERKGLLHVYANPWAKWKPHVGHFAYVEKVGGACYVVSREVMEVIGNPYTGQTDGEKANARFWKLLHGAGHPMHIRWTNPYQCQHTGNVESTIFGHTPKWEALYAKDFKTGNLVEVPPFRMRDLRAAVKARRLSSYVVQMNATSRVKVKVPAP